jgi:hypothetical protein
MFSIPRLLRETILAVLGLVLLTSAVQAQAVVVSTPPQYNYFQVAFGEQTTLVAVFRYENGRYWDRGGVIWTAHPNGAGPAGGVTCAAGSYGSTNSDHTSSACMLITNSTAGTFTVTATVAGANAPVATFTVLNYANVALETASLPAASAGSDYVGTIAGRDGSSPLSYVVTGGSTPPGIWMTSSGMLLGRPSAVGTYDFEVTVTDNGNIYGLRSTDSAWFSVTVNPPDLTLPAAIGPNATYGASYSRTISGSGGSAPHGYSMSGGRLPNGVTLSTNGTLSGTPSESGSFDFSVTMTDSTSGPGAPYSTSADYTLVVDRAQTALTLPAIAATEKDATATFVASGLPSGATGTVSFFLDGASLGDATVANGSASATTGQLLPGNYVLKARYNGDSNYAPSTETSVNHLVNRGGLQVTLVQPSQELLAGDTVTATISAPAATGQITFELDGTPLAPAQTLVSGSASYTLPQLPPGPHILLARYSGDAIYGPAQSAPITIGVRNTASISLKLQTGGQDTTVAFSSATPELNVVVTTSGGSGQSPAIALMPGTYVVTAQDAAGAGSALVGLYCTDSNGSVSAETRTATINLDIAESVVCTFSAGPSAQETQQIVETLMETSAGFLLANQPDMARRIGRLTGGFSGGSLGAAIMSYLPQVMAGTGTRQISASLAAIDAATGNMQQNRFDIWMDGTFGLLNGGSTEARSMAFSFGADYLVTSDLLLGGFIQLDSINQWARSGPSMAGANGWLAGPYMSARLSDQLFLDLLAGYGMASNKVSPLGTFEDAFSSSRYLLSATLSGQIEMEDWTFEPRAQLSYFSETSAAYTDALGTFVPGSTVGVGQLAVGPGVRYKLLDDGTVSIETGLRLDGVLSLASGSSQSLQGRVEADVRLGFDTGTALSLTGTMSGLGAQERGLGLRANLLVQVR